MNRKARLRFQTLAGACALAAACAALLLWAQPLRAASWGGIEPLKSRRADVERLLGRPAENKPGQEGTLRFKVAGGTVIVAFVDARFVAAHKLDPELEGTVRQLVLQHENAPDTPESLKLADNKAFEREARGNITVYRNQRDGLAYFFLDSKLKTTYYNASAEQLKRAQKG